MSGLLIAIAVYITLDRLLTIALVDRPISITRGGAVLGVITGAFIVTVLLIAAFEGVTP